MPSGGHWPSVAIPPGMIAAMQPAYGGLLPQPGMQNSLPLAAQYHMPVQPMAGVGGATVIAGAGSMSGPHFSAFPQQPALGIGQGMGYQARPGGLFALGRCAYCLESGHAWRQCPQREANIPPSNPNWRGTHPYGPQQMPAALPRQYQQQPAAAAAHAQVTAAISHGTSGLQVPPPAPASSWDGYPVC